MGMIITVVVVLVVLSFLIWLLRHTLIIINESAGEVGLKLRLGKYVGQLDPGWHFVVPVIYSVVKVDTRQQPLKIDEQALITRDNATVLATEQLKFHVTDAQRYALKNSNAISSMIQDVQSNLRSIIGGMELNAVLEGSEAINQKLAVSLDSTTQRYGIKVDNIAISGLKPDAEIEQSMNHQAAAFRERQAEILRSEGKQQAIQNQATANAFATKAEADAQAYSKKQIADANAYSTLKAAQARRSANQSVISGFGDLDFSVQDYLTNQQIQAFAALANSNANTVVVPNDQLMAALKTAEVTKIAKSDKSASSEDTKALIDELSKNLNLNPELAHPTVSPDSTTGTTSIAADDYNNSNTH